MRKLFLLVLLLSLPIRAEEAPETDEQKTTVKVREYDHLGYPIYYDDEPLPTDLWVCIRHREVVGVKPEPKTIEVSADPKVEKSCEAAKAFAEWLAKQADDAKEAKSEAKAESKLDEKPKVKVREIMQSTGSPIYEEGEPIPPGIQAHVRRKDGSFLGMPQSSSPSSSSTSDVATVTRMSTKGLGDYKFSLPKPST